MKNIHTKIFLLVITFFILSDSAVNAQGSYLCRVNNTSVPATCEMLPGSANCNTGYLATGAGCAGLSTANAPDSQCQQTGVPCEEDPDYGGAGEPCRTGSKCDAGFICLSGKCQGFVQPSPGTTIGPIATPNTEDVRCGDAGINSAIGCIPYTPSELGKFLLKWATGIAGGVALLMSVYAGVIIMTSGPDPKKLQGGKELLTASIAGLALVIFSAFILRILGVDILGLFS